MKCRYPCGICSDPVTSNQKGILCEVCNIWLHANCIDSWSCKKCLSQALPFANTSTMSTTDDSCSNTSSLSLDTSTESISTTATIVRKNNSFHCTVLNARSIVNKRLDLHALLMSKQIAVTETFCNDDVLDSELSSSHYSIFRRDRNRHGGGVLLMIRSNIPATRRRDLESACEILWTELPKHTLLGVYYRPPNHSTKLSELQQSLTRLPSSHHVILCGDFNIPQIDWTTTSPTTTSQLASELCDTLNDFALHQLVTEPTRLNNILDLVVTNNPDKTTNVSVSDGLPGSDHLAVNFEIVSTFRKQITPPKTLYNFRKADFDSFRDLISKIPWDTCFLSEQIEDIWTCIKDLLFASADQCIPKYTLRSSKGHTSWLSEETLKLIKHKRRAFKKCKRTKKVADLNRFKELNHKVRTLTREDHNHHLDSLINNLNANNQKPFWNWIKRLRGGTCLLPNLHHMGHAYQTAIDKAKIMNQYFSSVFTRESTSGLTSLQSDLQPTNSVMSTTELQVTEDEVLEALLKIDPSKSAGPDEIPGRLLREGAVWLSVPLTKLYNLSLSKGSLPSDWTRSNVTPIFKKGNKHLPSNYRPISLTSIVVKTLERLIQQKIYKFLTDHQKLSPYQHGFRARHSCQTQLLQAIHQWAKTLNQGSSTHAIFIDFSKAFDSVPHERLLLKLHNIGIRGTLLQWIKAFLLERQQRVLVEGHLSSWTKVCSGVPQGSVLGPLLFIIYVNDIASTLSSECKLFADDCVLYQNITSNSDSTALQYDLNQVSDWCKKWQLSLNIAKCKAICITNKKISTTSAI